MVLTAISGALCVLQGLYLFGSPLSLPYSGIPLPAAGAVSALVGVVLLIVADLYRTLPEYRPRFGPLVVVLAAADLWFGGGFLVGTVIGLIGGVLMIALPVENSR